MSSHQPQTTTWYQTDIRSHGNERQGGEYIRVYASHQDITNDKCVDSNCLNTRPQFKRLTVSSGNINAYKAAQNGHSEKLIPKVTTHKLNSVQISPKSPNTLSPGHAVLGMWRSQSPSTLNADNVSLGSSLGLLTSYPPQPAITSSMSCLSNEISLSHIDFWPGCRRKALMACDAVFETFDALIVKANKWLKQFNTYELINCETVDKKVIYVRDIYSAAMYFTDEDTPVVATHIKGLRIWYRNRPQDSPKGAQEIAFADVIPRYLNPGEKHPIFDTLPETVIKINQCLAEKPLPGRIISTESLSLKIAREDWTENTRLDTCHCQWYDEYNIHLITFLRLFYIRGHPPASQVIGIIDFTPDALDEGGIFHPAKYTPFSQLFTRAAEWIKSNKGIYVTNIQSLDTKHRKRSENHGRRFNTDKMFEYRIEERFRAFFIRLGYVVCTARDQTGPDLQCRMYLPVKKTNGYENITEILQRVETAIADTGARVYHVETLPMPEWITKPELCEKGERTFFDGEWYFVSDQDGNDRGPYRYTLIYAIRVYYEGLPAEYGIPKTTEKQKKKCCCIM